MGTPTWPKLPPLIEGLLAEAARFDYFQALRLIQILRGGSRLDDAALERWLRVRPVEGLGFPAADLHDCTIDANGRLILRTRVLGLYGVDAPLPRYFLDRATADDEGALRLRAFLDIFNHRLYLLLYQAWRLQHPFAERADSPYRATVAAAAGRLGTGLDTLPPAAGLNGGRQRSAAGLHRLLQNLLPDVSITVRDRLPQPVRIEASGGLGPTGPCLGETALLGDTMMVAGGRIRIEVGEMSIDATQKLLPETGEGRRLLRAISLYLGGSREFDLVLVVSAGKVGPCRLGNGVRLGVSGWLGDRITQGHQILIDGEQLPERDALPIGLAA